MLIEVVLFWYVPIIFGLYGIVALRIKKKIGNSDKDIISYILSFKDLFVSIHIIIIAILGGGIGLLFFLLQFLIFKPNLKNFDIHIAVSGTITWLAILFVFFALVWSHL